MKLFVRRDKTPDYGQEIDLFKSDGKKPPKKKGSEGEAAPGPEKPQAADPNQQSYAGQNQKEGESKAKGERIMVATTRQVQAPEPASPGDVIEFKHPQHGRTTRGRVTAQGMDGVTARIADGSAVQVPHGHVQKTLPEHDFGADPDATPADAKAAFLAPTQPGGMPATELQIALLDTAAQFGVPLDAEQLETMDYDAAKKFLCQIIGADEGDLTPDDDGDLDGDDDPDDIDLDDGEGEEEEPDNGSGESGTSPEDLPDPQDAVHGKTGVGGASRGSAPAPAPKKGSEPRKVKKSLSNDEDDALAERLYRQVEEQK